MALEALEDDFRESLEQSRRDGFAKQHLLGIAERQKEIRALE